MSLSTYSTLTGVVIAFAVSTTLSFPHIVKSQAPTAEGFFTRNLRMMRKHRVRVIVGSDSYRNTPVPEAMYLASLGVYTNAELLKVWSVETPRAIFPNRRIGRLEPGSEASFLVLDKDPRADFSNVKSIRLRVKQGVTIPDSAR